MNISVDKTTADTLTMLSPVLDAKLSLLQEYRTRLVADVVTGKLDVREAAARLPEGAGVLEPHETADLGGEVEKL